MSTSPATEPPGPDTPDLVFNSYSHDDDPKWLKLLRDHLAPLERDGIIQLWVDKGKIESGDRFNDDIAAAIDDCKAAILLVSSSFQNSSFIQEKELPRLLRRADAKKIRLYWLLVSDCLLADELAATYHCANDSQKALNAMSEAEVDKVLANLTRDLKKHALQARAARQAAARAEEASRAKEMAEEKQRAEREAAADRQRAEREAEAERKRAVREAAEEKKRLEREAAAQALVEQARREREAAEEKQRVKREAAAREAARAEAASRDREVAEEKQRDREAVQLAQEGSSQKKIDIPQPPPLKRILTFAWPVGALLALVLVVTQGAKCGNRNQSSIIVERPREIPKEAATGAEPVVPKATGAARPNVPPPAPASVVSIGQNLKPVTSEIPSWGYTADLSDVPVKPEVPQKQPPEPPPEQQVAPKLVLPAYHKVGPDESLFTISQQYGVSVESLKKANGLTSDLIRVGQTLRLALAQHALGMPTPPEEKVAPKPVPSSSIPSWAYTSIPTYSATNPYTNSQGMKFVPVPGTTTLMSIWETRIRDYAEFAEENPGINMEWKDYEFEGHKQTDDHPVVYVSWEDAKAFCAWLSKKDGRTYRLPTDHEWSVAVGIGTREDPKLGPKAKDMKLVEVYPWGSSWPPTPGNGNYAGEETGFNAIEGYKDPFPFTAPVGSFTMNHNGIYDLSGNVVEWCEDEYSPSPSSFVLRGGSWRGYDPDDLLSSGRSYEEPTGRNDDIGFRCVLEGEAAGGGKVKGASATVSPNSGTEEFKTGFKAGYNAGYSEGAGASNKANLTNFSPTQDYKEGYRLGFEAGYYEGARVRPSAK